MLISSRSIRRKCPVCGAANCTCGGPSTVIPVDHRMEAFVAEKLVRVDLGRGRGVMMRESEARARGLLPPLPAAKAQRPALNKKRQPGENKG